MSENREETLLRTSEVYRRMRSQGAPERSDPPVELARDAGPLDTARAVPHPEPEARPLPPPGPSFWRRMLTRRPDIREVLLLAVLAAALLASKR